MTTLVFGHSVAFVAAHWRLARNSWHVSWRSGCPFGLKPTDRCAPVLGNRNSTACLCCRNALIFPNYRHIVQQMKTTALCRRPGCNQCAACAETSTIHFDCLELLVRECKLQEPLNFLWAMTAWRFLWRQAPDLHLNNIDPVLPLPAFLSVYSLGLPGLRLLPAEIIQCIRNYFVANLLGRFSAALDLAYQLSPIVSEDLISIPLCQVAAWERGGQPVLVTTSSQPPIICITIDSSGIFHTAAGDRTILPSPYGKRAASKA